MFSAVGLEADQQCDFRMIESDVNTVGPWIAEAQTVINNVIEVPIFCLMN